MTFHNAETPLSVLDGFTLTNGKVGVYCEGRDTEPVIGRCVIRANTTGIDGPYASPTIIECTIEANSKVGISNCAGKVEHCLIAGNGEHGLAREWNAGITVTNSVIVQNLGRGLNHVWVEPYFTSSYNTIWGNKLGSYRNLSAGPGDLHEKPWLARPGHWDTDGTWHKGDYHLRSKMGRWDPITETWVTDPTDSPCLDRGDPNTPIGDEPYPHGDRINQGAYGGTDEASLSEGPQPMCVEYPEMDFNGDCKVDQADLDIFLQHWLECNLDLEDACWPDGPPQPPVVPGIQP